MKMRVVPATLLIGAAVAAVPPVQQILEAPREDFDAETLPEPLESIQDKLKSIWEDTHELWDEASYYLPSKDDLPTVSMPKPSRRRPDSHWDHIVRGSDVQSIWVTGANGQKEREIDGKLEAYDLRVKKVDPSTLGIDPDVKQYSGYLDDNENDKHLFYCKLSREGTILVSLYLPR